MEDDSEAEGDAVVALEPTDENVLGMTYHLDIREYVTQPGADVRVWIRLRKTQVGVMW